MRQHAVILFSATLCLSHAKSDLKLTAAGYKRLVFASGVPASFIQFTNSSGSGTPAGCRLCDEMKDDWSTLAKTYKKSKELNIGTVDCNAAENHDLCRLNHIIQLPTLQYFLPPNPEAEYYEAERDLANLTAFANQLANSCDPVSKQHCTTDEVEKLAILDAKDVEDIRNFTIEMRNMLDGAKKDWIIALTRVQKFMAEERSKAGQERMVDELKEAEETITKLISSNDAAYEFLQSNFAEIGPQYRLLKGFLLQKGILLTRGPGYPGIPPEVEDLEPKKAAEPKKVNRPNKPSKPANKKRTDGEELQAQIDKELKDEV